MPSVSPTHGWILWEIAKKRLQEAGYRVEKHGQRLAAYHGVGLTTCFPDFLTIVNGKCSPRTVDRLVKKLRKCSDCGKHHDPNIRCPHYHAGMQG